MFDTALTFNDLLFMLKGAGVTLSVTAFAVVGGTLLGVFFGVLRSQISPWAALPLTSTQKIQRRELKELAERLVQNPATVDTRAMKKRTAA